MDFKQYQTWIKPFPKEGKAISPGVTEYAPEIIKENGQALIQIIRRHVANNEFRNLAALAEFLSGNGFFYFDYVAEMGVILEMMLLQAIAVFEEERVVTDRELLWVPHALYDLIFHQIRFDEYPPVCFELYFRLSERVLSPRFMRL